MFRQRQSLAGNTRQLCVSSEGNQHTGKPASITLSMLASFIMFKKLDEVVSSVMSSN